MFETLYHLTNMVQAFGHGTETWRMKELVVQKKVLEMMGRTIPCKYHEKCVLGRPPHGISWQFSICRCSQNNARFKNPLHAPAENVHFVRGLEALCYQILGQFWNHAKFFWIYICQGLWEFHSDVTLWKLFWGISALNSPQKTGQTQSKELTPMALLILPKHLQLRVS